VCTLDETFGINHHAVVLPACPMFHANAWGIPLTADRTGFFIPALG
jgi:hypothetical protein